MQSQVSAGFVLGWQMSRLYATPLPRARAEASDVPAHLPGSSRLPSHETLMTRTEQLMRATKDLADLLDESTSTLVTTFVRDVQATTSESPQVPDQRKRILAVHVAILRSTTASLPEVGKAYSLGRALADTCRPQQSWEDLRESFAERRISTLRGWLYDLDTKFPQRSAATVRGSLDSWSLYIAGLTEAPSSNSRLALSVRRQGQIWRSFLSEERDPAENISPTAYLVATSMLLAMNRRILLACIRTVLPILVIGSVPFAAVIILAQSLSNRLWSAIGSSLATALFAFVSAKAVFGQVKQVMLHVEKPLWEQSLNAAIADTHTLRPAKRNELSVHFK